MEVCVVDHPLAAVAGRVIPLQRQNLYCCMLTALHRASRLAQ